MINNNPYNFFDKIICINLTTRKDRYESAKNEFNNLNIPNVEFYIANKSSNGGRYGCFESHINVIKKAYIQGCDNILIFEDDLRPSNYYNISLLEDSIEFIKNNNFDIFYLGYMAFNKNYITDNIIFTSSKNKNNIIQYNPCGTQSYCINKNGMIKILDNYEKYLGNEHYDTYLQNKNYFKNYCITPMLFEQHWCSPHDNSIHGLDEYIARKYQCFFGDYLNYSSNISYYIYLYNKYKITLFIFIISILILYFLQ